LIVVADDEVVAAAAKISDKSREESLKATTWAEKGRHIMVSAGKAADEETSWTKKVRRALPAAGKAATESAKDTDWRATGVMASMLVGGPLVGALAAVIAKELSSRTRKMSEHGVAVLTVTRTQAVRELQFPLGHPRYSVLYVGHPAVPSSYIPMGDFHRFLFEHKVAEALLLLTALGASELEVERIAGKAALADVSASLHLPVTEEGAGVSVGGHRSSSSQLLLKARLSSHGTPTIPADLVWYSHEPLWQSLAQMRMNHNLSTFSLDVRYGDDFGVNAALKGHAVRAGLDIAGKFESYEGSTWRMMGTFADIGGS
jgi:hypothetical protein